MTYVPPHRRIAELESELHMLRTFSAEQTELLRAQEARIAATEAARAQAQHWLDEFQGLVASETLRATSAEQRANAIAETLRQQEARHAEEIERLKRAHADLAMEFEASR